MQAEAILRFALYKEVLKRSRRKKRKLNRGTAAEDDDEEEDGSEEEEEVEEAAARMEGPQPAKEKAIDDPVPAPDPVWGDGSQDVDMDAAPPQAQAGPTDDGGVRPERYVFLRASHDRANSLFISPLFFPPGAIDPAGWRYSAPA